MSIYSQVNLWDIDDDFRISKVKQQEPQTLIDLGCGNGRLTFPMAEFVPNIVAIDPDTEAINEAISLDKDSRIKWIVGNSKDIKETNIDVITMLTNVSQEIVNENEWKETLIDCYNALKENGTLIYDSRNFYQQGWLNWTKDNTYQKVTHNNEDAGFWHQVYDVDHNIVKFNTHIKTSSNEEIYDSTLIFRTKGETAQLLMDIGFNKIEVYGDWTDIEATDEHKAFLFIAYK